ncbi:hypothetical protein VP01_269g3 [Puccinia sorghi]|uniref:Uncharacterized protein n=1 Tax=Puccinia sorghi TaxID=27349 RepID=A0A0L6V3N7_9BASI|nr:hypothetical protein VP01_269g3 [Puccinia sorghi]
MRLAEPSIPIRMLLCQIPPCDTLPLQSEKNQLLQIVIWDTLTRKVTPICWAFTASAAMEPVELILKWFCASTRMIVQFPSRMQSLILYVSLGAKNLFTTDSGQDLSLGSCYDLALQDLPGVSPTGGLSSASAPLYIPQLAIYHPNHNSSMGMLLGSIHRGTWMRGMDLQVGPNYLGVNSATLWKEKPSVGVLRVLIREISNMNFSHSDNKNSLSPLFAVATPKEILNIMP